MSLIDDWWETLKKSYTMWLTYAMMIAGAAETAIHEAPPGVIPDDWVPGSTTVLLRIVLICTVLQIPARIIHQKNLPSK